MANATTLKLMLVGDLILDEPDADTFFEPARSILQQADVLVGQVEVPHTRRGRENTSDVPAPPSDPDNLTALKHACFHVATLAGNHISDAGSVGMAIGTLKIGKLHNVDLGDGVSTHAGRVVAYLHGGRQ